MNISFFKDNKFIDAVKQLFKDLNVPINYVTESPAQAQDILKETYKDNETFRLIEDVYFVGMIDDAAFNREESIDIKDVKSDYDGILVFGVILKERQNGLLPTRSQLAEIARSFNREFYYTPVVVLFKYNNHIALANTERLKYKQEWREGEKVGKVSLLRDIDIDNPHTGHLQILNELKISTNGLKHISTFAELYDYWQEVFSVSLLNKKFYQELSNWYFWAVKQVTFPGKPTELEAISKGVELGDLIQEHNATNVIRLLTRLLFTWFIKEKKLIPEDLFDLDTLQNDILTGIEPYHQDGLFNQANLDSVYYKAILQNLFFATLNCPIKSDSVDNRSRGFRGEAYGQHRGIDYLMRYKKYFKSPDAFLEMMNNTVPFLNGGLFECLDDKDNNIFIDGFSDNLTNGHKLIVPDYLFFGTQEEVDLSEEYGYKDKETEKAAVKGLINILKSYKFTIAENTPIEEEVALDPELLGRVFENLLASYNPETKSTARKQTGSFYTPREIVNYMVDESLIAYLKSAITDWGGLDEKAIDKELHTLTSFDNKVPFRDNPVLEKEIITALSACTILDPACGSGAFPMGILQKMVHILQKLDIDNKTWKAVQLERAVKESEAAFEIEDKQAREERLLEINNAFDQSINDPDYARKLFLIENCIYGVDIQPIATQISKLRFFISLVVEQKVNPEKENFGIRPLPNLETKFVAANTLVGIEKVNNLFSTDEIRDLERQLKRVRSKLFGARTKETKIKYRNSDKRLRVQIAEVLKEQGLPVDSAEKLASWDPYDQNASSSFFDPEWMFDIKEGFEVVIGNPPYIKEYTDRSVFDGIRGGKYYQGKMDLWYAFACISIDLLVDNGLLCFIATNNWVTNSGASILREKIISETKIEQLHDFGNYMIFESAAIQTMILLARKGSFDNYLIDLRRIQSASATLENLNELLQKVDNDSNSVYQFKFEKDRWKEKTLNFETDEVDSVLRRIAKQGNFYLDSKTEVATGIDVHQDFLNKRGKQILGNTAEVGEGIFNISSSELLALGLIDNERHLIKPFYTTTELKRFWGSEENEYWIIYTDSSFKDENKIKPYPNLKRHLDRFRSVITSDNWPYGLHRARKECFFKDEKIISLRKCSKPTFTYTDFDCYVSQTFFVIKTNRINQKYLTAILNSKVIEFWLRFKGKMQGDLFQVDKAPLLEIPICKSDKQDLLATVVDFIIYNGKRSIDTVLLEQLVNAVVFNLYFPDHMKERGIDVMGFAEQDVKDVMQGREFDLLTDNEKEQIAQLLNNKWTDPKNEVVRRISMFKEKSPDILKPILES